MSLKHRASHLVILAGLIGALFIFGTPTAFADSLTLNLSKSAVFGDADYGTVSMNLNAGKIDVTISLLNGVIVDTGAHHAVTFNESIAGNPALAISNISTPLLYSFLNDPSGAAGSYDQAGVGAFEFALSGPGTSAGSGAVATLSFTVARKSGTAFNSVNDLMEALSGGAVFSVDILQGSPCSGACSGIVYATTGPLSTPEPSSSLLLGFGMLGVAVGFRRFGN
jgi:hypothetical protein